MNSDKRKFPRVAAHATVLVESLEAGGAEELARTNTIGRGGCGFLSAEPLGEGTPLLVLISAGLDVVRVHGRVAHSRPVDGGNEVGVEFLDLGPEDEAKLERLLVQAE